MGQARADLGDVVDALARALGRVPGVLDEPVEVFLPRYSLGRPCRTDATPETLALRVPDPRVAAGVSRLAVRSFEAAGYRLRLVDHPACVRP